MSIIRAIERAFALAKEKQWDSIYWCIDLHDTCFKANYEPGKYEWINADVVPALRAIQKHSKSTIILWTSCYKTDYWDIRSFFTQYGIVIDYINKNPEIKNTRTGNFKKKFYFSIGIDDKFGFDPNTDWKLIQEYLTSKINE